MSSYFFKDLLSCWVIITLSVCTGFLINQFRETPLPLVYQSKAERLQLAVSRISDSQTPAEITQLPTTLSLEQFKDFMKQRRGLVFDARPELFHRLGHIPGTLLLPRDEFEDYYKIHREILERDKNQLICIYCSGGDCEDSKLVESALLRLGYTHVIIFEGGWNEWTKAGLPKEASAK